MSRQSIHITIPKPCHERWESMDATEQGAFCQSCQKEVIDFSAMTDREVIEYLAKHQTGCGRFRQDQLDIKLTIPQVDNGVFRWKALFLSFLSVISIKNLMAQSGQLPTAHSLSVYNNQKTSGQSSEVIHLSGKVLDENNEGLIGANVLLLDSLGRSMGIGVCTDFDGNFSLEVKGLSYQFRCSYVGYFNEDIILTAESNQSFKVTLKPKPYDPQLKVNRIKMGFINSYIEDPKDSLKH